MDTTILKKVNASAIGTSVRTSVLFLAVGFLTFSCSTPPVADSQEQNYANAVSAYDYCLTSAHPVGYETPCNNVYSYSGYGRSYSAYISGSSSSTQLRARSESESKIFKAAYTSYLASLSPEDLADMARQWREIAGTQVQ